MRKWIKKYLLLLQQRAPVSIAPSLPDVASSTRLLDLQADALSLSDGAAVSTWTNAGTAGGSFMQSGAARPTYHANAGHPYVMFDGVNDWMEASGEISATLDGPTSFDLFLVLRRPDHGVFNPYRWIISKMDNYSSGAGWAIVFGSKLLLQEDGGNNWIMVAGNSPQEPDGSLTVITWQVLGYSFANITQYVNGVLYSDVVDQSTPPIANISTATTVRLGTDGALDDFYDDGIAAVMLFEPAMNASDRASIEGWLAGKYGI